MPSLDKPLLIDKSKRISSVRYARLIIPRHAPPTDKSYRALPSLIQPNDTPLLIEPYQSTIQYKPRPFWPIDKPNRLRSFHVVRQADPSQSPPWRQTKPTRHSPFRIIRQSHPPRTDCPNPHKPLLIDLPLLFRPVDAPNRVRPGRLNRQAVSFLFQTIRQIDAKTTVQIKPFPACPFDNPILHWPGHSTIHPHPCLITATVLAETSRPHPFQTTVPAASHLSIPSDRPFLVNPSHATPRVKPRRSCPDDYSGRIIPNRPTFHPHAGLALPSDMPSPARPFLAASTYPRISCHTRPDRSTGLAESFHLAPIDSSSLSLSPRSNRQTGPEQDLPVRAKMTALIPTMGAVFLL